MGLLPEQATFEELVADAFAAFRGSGVMLSPLDAELVSDWAERRIPFEVIARGLQRAAEKALWDAKPGEPTVRSIRACRKDVETEIKKHLRATAGRAEPESVEVTELVEVRSAPDAIKKGLRKLAKHRPELSDFCKQVADEPAFSDRFPIKLLRRLPFPERVTLIREAKSLAQGQVIFSAHGRKLSRRFHRAAVLRRALDLPPFW